jgi:uncharacterized protein (DUF488 family)
MLNKLTTIGFSKKSLQQFVALLQQSNVTRLVDTRLNNTSQLSGFSKKQDLQYVMQLVGIDYLHETILAPTEEILSAYKKKQMNWEEYEKQYIELLERRKIDTKIEDIMEDELVCFLCSEEKPHHCHRRLLAEYIQERSKNIKIIHLV